MDTILITGGAGYIGSICCERLLEVGYKVVVVDNLNTGHKEAVSHGSVFVEGNMGDTQLMDEVIKKHKPTSVIHFAGETLVSKANIQPDVYFSNNISNGLKLLDVLVKHGIDDVIFSSSAAVYGNPETDLIREDHPTNPLNAYGDSKLIFEKILQRYKEAYGLRYVAFRYFNPVGASEKFGEAHTDETHLVPLVLQCANEQRDHIAVFGDDYDTPDGTPIRDFVDVVNLVNAHIEALPLIKNLNGMAINLGSGHGFSVLQIVKVAERVTKRKIPVRITNRRMGDPRMLVASSDLAKKLVNWHPQNQDIERMINSAWKWHTKHPSGYRVSKVRKS